MTDSTRKTSPEFASDAERFACYAARLLADSRCENPTVLDVSGLSQVTDYLVIAAAGSSRMIRSVADDLKQLGRQEDQSVFRTDGAGASEWAVVDFVDVVAHVLTVNQRVYYDLESLWGDAKRVDWQSRTSPGQFAQLDRRAAG